jgi:hypothetical protein
VNVGEARREALEELRDQLAQGVDPDAAIKSAAGISGLKVEVVAKIGAVLISSREAIVASSERQKLRSDRKKRADHIMRLYRERLADDPNASGDLIDAEVGINDFSDHERDDLFDRKIDAWFDRNI